MIPVLSLIQCRRRRRSPLIRILVAIIAVELVAIGAMLW